MRARIIARDEGRCRWPMGDGTTCGEHASHVDHVHEGTTGSVPDDELWALCAPHHRHKTATEGGRAHARARAAAKRPERRHPGLRW